jgi:hypothetical protein
MTRWMGVLALAACTGATNPADTADSGDDPTPPSADGPCVYDLGLWCFTEESSTGPTQTVGSCPVPTVDSLLAQSEAAWHGRCEDPVHGTLDFVNIPSGYGGPYWYFDATGAFVSYYYTTDFAVFCNQWYAIAYGFDPSGCEDICVVGDDTTGYGYPPCP